MQSQCKRISTSLYHPMSSFDFQISEINFWLMLDELVDGELRQSKCIEYYQ